jgi:hypothetical protein
MIELVDPRGHPRPAAGRLAPRLGDLGALHKIGFLSNEDEHLTGPHFPGYTRILETAFRQRLGPLRFHREIKPVLSRPADQEMIEQFAGCQGVVNGLAK